MYVETTRKSGKFISKHSYTMLIPVASGIVISVVHATGSSETSSDETSNIVTLLPTMQYRVSGSQLSSEIFKKTTFQRHEDWYSKNLTMRNYPFPACILFSTHLQLTNFENIRTKANPFVTICSTIFNNCSFFQRFLYLSLVFSKSSDADTLNV